MDSISRFGWSGSAAVGGVLIERFGYGGTFLMTSGMQIFATCLYASIMPIVRLGFGV
ncbi:hypothetical protein T484DRAFT_1965692 [Baffinella frigidus]|nr:hypothetical protein T484DRAFT_1965692 [Cryptophyta sp. CCMP2293]